MRGRGDLAGFTGAGDDGATATDSVDGAISGDIKINVVAAAAQDLTLTTSFPSTKFNGNAGRRRGDGPLTTLAPSLGS